MAPRPGFVVLLLVLPLAAEPLPPTSPRAPQSEADLRYWLENMVWHHRFTEEEIVAATGMSPAAVRAAQARLGISATNRPKLQTDGRLLVLPYPGGRHPRIGFLDGALRPQRETKVSVFTPWDEANYVVVDVPEAIWSNLGLLYLAHEHVPTVWTKQSVTLEPLEWSRRDDGGLYVERTLPNGVRFATSVQPEKDGVRMAMALTNGTREKLTDLRVQNCVLLKGAKDFSSQTNENKVFSGPYAACRSVTGQRWVITAWHPLHRTWGNPPCPCLHSDPRFPDCEPGATVTIKGWLSFHEGVDVHAEFKRIDKLGWRD